MKINLAISLDTNNKPFWETMRKPKKVFGGFRKFGRTINYRQWVYKWYLTIRLDWDKT